ncbi:MAG: antibiotic biosynthesis monooxygenase [Deltaproteobacteria bacterium]|nr:antibiotic biosynthesis monooxygenase [Deltaproteobacteria bacterium]
MVTIVVHFHAAEGKRSELRKLLGRAVPRLADLPGCRGGSLYNDIDEPLLFVLVEHWESRPSHEAYLHRIEEDGTMDGLRPLLASDPERRYLGDS